MGRHRFVTQTPVSALNRRRQRQHVIRDGTAKRPFLDKKAADDFLKASGMYKTNESYQCDICRRWHTGHRQEEEKDQ